MRRTLMASCVALAGCAAIVMACGGGDGATGPLSAIKDPPIAPDSAGRVVSDSFASVALGITKTYLVYLPASYRTSTERRYPVAYFLHGITATPSYWIDSLQLNTVLDSLTRHRSPEMIVVMPDADNSFYHTWVNPPTYASCLARETIDKEPAATFCVPYMRYDEYIAHDLVGHIDSTYRTLADKAHRGLAGYSMGGGGAVYLSLTRSATFGAGASLSGGLFALLNIGPPDEPVNATDTLQLQSYYGGLWNDLILTEQYGTDLSKWPAYDPMEIANAMSPSTTIPPLWLMVGTYDGQMLKSNQVFHAALLRHSVPHEYSEVQGDHSAKFWRAHEGEAAAWLANKIKP